ncbi:MAG: peptidoglycan-associated lipoprotein Pal [Campylobacteraceae bacterium]|jgi:peptidoglycan-associated lipoprotein|nr:peptidoglycan-associated lipoprotein Pal [Campylobacteraceae bacterium]
MNKSLLFGAIAVLFLLSGCTDKATVDVGTQEATETQETASSTQEVDSVATNAQTQPVETTTVQSADNTDVLSSLIERLEQNAKSIYFAFDQFDISSTAQSAIEDNAKLFNLAEAESLSVKIEGNCDEWGTDEYNYALGLKRAKAVKDALVAQGVNEDRITIVSYGESNPACAESAKACWSKNRRADFKLFQ